MESDIRKSLQSLNSKADWTGIRFVEEDNRTLFVRDEKLESTHQELNTGAMVEVLVDGQFSYAATPDTSEQGLEQAYQKAMGMAEIAKSWKLATFTEEQRPKATGNYSTPKSAEQPISTYLRCRLSTTQPDTIKRPAIGIICISPTSVPRCQPSS